MRRLSSRSPGASTSRSAQAKGKGKAPRPPREEFVCTQTAVTGGAGQEQPGAHHHRARSALPSPLLPAGRPAPHRGGREQPRGKGSELQTQDKISMTSVEVFLLCCCTVLIKTCVCSDVLMKERWRTLPGGPSPATPRLAHGPAGVPIAAP